MIITTKTPTILNSLYDLYKKSNKNGKAYLSVRNCIMHNNEPVNILTAMTVLKDVKCLVGINWAHPVDFELTLRYLSDITGYSTIELNERLSY